MKKRRIIKLFLWGGIFIIGISIVYAFSLYKKVFVKVNLPKIKNLVTSTPTPTPDPLAPKNVLILGYGGPGHEGAALTDTMIIAHIIPKEKKIFLISIPRDIWVPIPMKDGNQYFKLNHAFAIGLDQTQYQNKLPKYQGIAGGGLLAEESVSLVTGLKVDNFVSMNFDGFKNIVNLLGGASVNVPYSFVDEYYPLKGKEDDVCGKTDEEMKLLHATLSGQLLEKEFKCRFEKIEFKKGSQVMDAETALKFVRSRHSEINGNDFGRSQRQQALIIAVKNQILKVGSIPKIIPLLNNIAKNVQTDIDIKTAINLMADNYQLSDIQIKSISLNTDNVLEESQSEDRQYILIPKGGQDNWKVINDYIQQNLSSPK